MFVTFVSLVCCVTLGVCSANESPEVQITNGMIRGRTFVSSWTNQLIYAFQGIPYAAPPVGNLRFKDPIPAANWTGTRECIEDGASCIQPSHVLGNGLKTSLSEDCLFLNVYAPNMHPETKLPVLVWIHGGAFYVGSGNYNGQGPDKLVAQNMIVVMLNYRLGPFGFLTLGIPEAPGNSGMKDQLLALKWVRDEISKFGGDPNKVTIFGESAGSASVHLQYLSPLSKDLFRGVIGDSGASLGNWAVRSNEGSVFYALQLAGLLNCSSPTNVSSAYDCLMAANASDINKVQRLGVSSPEDQDIGLALKFIPTIDKVTSSNYSFLPEFPATLIEQKQGSFVPFLMGINQDEGVLGLSGQASAAENITKYVDHFIPPEVRKRCSPSKLIVLDEILSLFYFNNTPVSDSSIKGLLDINTDASFAYPTVESARKFQERGKVFLYYFTFDGLFKDPFVVSMKDKYHNISLVAHAEELNYIFVDQKINQTLSDDSDEVKTWNRMVKMWSNFAIHGSPTVGDDALLQNVQWHPVNSTSTSYLWIDRDLKMVESDLLAERIALWDLVAVSSSILSQPTLVAVWFCATFMLLKSM